MALPDEQRLTVSKLPVLLTHLRSVIAHLESWDIRVAGVGRLRVAEKLIQGVISRGTYGEDPVELRLMAEALRLTLDFHAITQSLGADKSQRIATELERALGGTIDASDKTRRPYQFQSQFFAGAVMAHGGLDPRVPPDSAIASPDFLVQPGVLRIGIEVKRPSRSSRIRDSLRSGRAQLSSWTEKGILAIDVSDCLSDIGISHFVESSDQEPYAESRPQFDALNTEIAGLIWASDRQVYRHGFEPVLGLWVFARGWRWRLDDLSAPQLFDLHIMNLFASTKHNVWWYQGREIRDAIEQGLSNLGMVVAETAGGPV